MTTRSCLTSHSVRTRDFARTSQDFEIEFRPGFERLRTVLVASPILNPGQEGVAERVVRHVHLGAVESGIPDSPGRLRVFLHDVLDLRDRERARRRAYVLRLDRRVELRGRHGPLAFRDRGMGRTGMRDLDEDRAALAVDRGGEPREARDEPVVVEANVRHAACAERIVANAFLHGDQADAATGEVFVVGDEPVAD